MTGVFVLYADQLELSRNHILGNGPVIDEEGEQTATGVWGGVVVLFASGFSLATKLMGDQGDIAEGEFAARISGNVVDQPLSRALTMLAFGPLSVVDNSFNTASTSGAVLDLFVGGVLIVNFGGFHRFNDLKLRGKMHHVKESEGVENLGPISGEAGGGGNPDGASTAEMRWMMVDPQSMAEIGPSLDLGAVEAPQENLPDGNTLFNDNQTRLGPRTRSAIAQLIVTTDDLGFDGNQCDMMPTLENLAFTAVAPGLVQMPFVSLINTVLVGFTLRANDSRFKETLVEQFRLRALSLLSISYTLNNTTTNQGNHCIIAASLLEAAFPGRNMRVSEGNQSLFYPIGACKQMEERIVEQPRLLILLFLGLLLGRV